MERDDNFRALAENANDGILIATSEGKHVYANRKASEITGFSIQEILEIKMQDLAHADAFRKLESRLKKRLEGKSVPTSYETAILRKDGKKVPVEITGAKTSWEGQPADIVIIRDITDRKHKEEELEARVERRTAELKKTTEQLKALMNATTDTILLIDLKGYAVAANTVAARRLGISLNQLLGTCAYDLLPPPLAKSRKAKADRVVKTGKPHRLEDERGGIIFDSTIYPVIDEQGTVVQLAIYGKDITKQVKVHRELEKKEKDLEEKTSLLYDANTALKIMLQKSSENKKEVEEEILTVLKKRIAPYISKLKQCNLDMEMRDCVSMLESNLKEIVSPFSRKLSFEYINLTPKEIQVANLIRKGKATKEISQILNLKKGTVDTHRNSIRRGVKSAVDS